MEDKFYLKYLKYKSKYTLLKIMNQIGGGLKENIIRQGNIDGIDSLHIISYLQTLILSFPLVMDAEFNVPETKKIADTAASLSTRSDQTKSKPWCYLIWRALQIAGYDVGFDRATIHKYYHFDKDFDSIEMLAIQLSTIPQWPEYAMNILLNYRSDPSKKKAMSQLTYDSPEIIKLAKFYTGDPNYLNPILYTAYKKQ